MSSFRRQLTIVACAIAVVIASPAAASARDRIEGLWSIRGGHEVRIGGEGSRFSGVFVGVESGELCGRRPGEYVWSIRKTGRTTYSGTERVFTNPIGCVSERVSVTWRVRRRQGRYVVVYCRAQRCSTLERLRLPRDARILVSSEQISGGDELIVSGFAPGCPGRITLTSHAFDSDEEFAGVPAIRAAVDDEDGYFRTEVRIADIALDASYSIGARCGGASIGSSATLRAR